MPLDPQVQAMLETARAANLDPFAGDVFTVTAAEMRRRIDALPAVAEVEPVARVETRVITGTDGNPISLRIYAPLDSVTPLPVVLFFHGGGWVIGVLPMHDDVVRRLANRSGAIFVLVDYRVAPEHPFPAPVDDCYSATKWVAENASQFGGDSTRLAVAGDSAGGNLAAAVALMARDRGGPSLVFQLLVYPCTDMNPERWPSMSDNATGYSMTRDALRWFYGHYLGDGDRKHPYVAPYQAPDLSKLPPAMVITAEYDPLRDEGEAFAARLEEAGVAVECVRYDGQVHGFFAKTAALDRAREAQTRAAVALRSALAGTPTPTKA